MAQRITIKPDQLAADKTALVLSAAQTHYLTRVLRLNAGDRFIAQDGEGHQWLAAIAPQPHRAEVIQQLPAAHPPHANLQLIAALTKGNSFDAVVRQTTELGVTHLHPVTTARTVLKPSANKITRWKRIAQEASEQSERITVPEISEPATFQDRLERIEQACIKQNNDSWQGGNSHRRSLRFICAARTSAQKVGNNNLIVKNNHLLSRLLFHQQTLSPSAGLPSVVIAIGPEGGWTTEEITVATAYDYEVVSLGPAILRAVTASITALSLVTAARELLI